MAATTIAREIRKGFKAGGRKAALVGAAAATATAMTVGMTATPAVPLANALPDTLTTTTTGPLFWLISHLGVDSVTVPDIPVLGSLTLNLGFTKADSVSIYDAINANAYGGITGARPNIFASAARPPGRWFSPRAGPCRARSRRMRQCWPVPMGTRPRGIRR